MKIATLVSLVAVSVAGLVSAQAHGLDVPTKRISFADLNLSSTSGQAALYRRLKTAASQVCGDSGEMHYNPITWTLTVDRCIQDAMVHATAAINVPEFTAYVTSLAPTEKAIRLAKK